MERSDLEKERSDLICELERELHCWFPSPFGSPRKRFDSLMLFIFTFIFFFILFSFYVYFIITMK